MKKFPSDNYCNPMCTTKLYDMTMYKLFLKYKSTSDIFHKDQFYKVAETIKIKMRL